MANVLIQFRADESTKKKASKICEQLGMDLPTYFRMCMAKMILEGGVPFEAKIDKSNRNEGVELLRRVSKRAEENGISDMSLEEINAVISEVRKASK